MSRRADTASDSIGAVPAPLPANEDARLEALTALCILDTGAEEAFDNLARLAAAICDVPIALVSLVDAERQWFKARVGLDARETHRDLAFCAHAILQPDLFVVNDALLDDRFARNPLVVGDPQIRFYAGAPLETEPNIRLGTLCVIDRQPRQLTAQQQQVLRALCDHAVALLRLRWTNLELVRTEARYRRLFEQANDAIYLHDLEGRFVALNPTAEELLGYTTAEARGMTVAQILAPPHGSELAAAGAVVLTTEPGSPVERELIRKDGRRLVAEISAQTIVENGRPYVEVIARDITARKRLERQRADYLAMLAHDIRNPLHVIAASIELARSADRGTAHHDELFGALARSSDTLLSLVTNYLEAERIEAGEVMLQRTRIDMSALLQRVVDSQRPAAAARDVALTLDVARQLPPVDGDATALERVFQNLVHNAVKFTPDGARVAVSARAEGASVRVSVVDTGPGIDATEVAGIFDRYRQTARGRTKAGAGLGLFIVRKLVEQHGGIVHVESHAAGSTFVVALPCAHGLRSRERGDPAEHMAPSATG